MTKPKCGAEAAARSAAKRAGMLLRAAVTKQLREGGEQTAAQVHAAIGGNFEDVRTSLYRLVKAGGAKSQRGTDRMRNSIFCLAEQTVIARNAGTPHRPVLKEWEPIHRRDVLHCFLFGMPEMRGAA